MNKTQVDFVVSGTTPSSAALAERCRTCRRSWPVVTFPPGNDTQTAPRVCLRCGNPKLAREIWRGHRSKMAKRIKKAAEKEPARQDRYHQLLMRARAESGTHPSDPLALLLEASQWPPRTKKGDKVRSGGPSGAAEAVTPASAQTGASTQRAALSGQSGGDSSLQGSREKLAPLAIRVLEEPKRTLTWIQCNYVSQPGSSLPQKAIFSHYIFSMTDNPPPSVKATALTKSEIDQAYYVTGRLQNRIPDLLKGVEVMNVLSSLIKGVTMVKDGWLCSGIAVRPREETETMERAAANSLTTAWLAARKISSTISMDAGQAAAAQNAETNLPAQQATVDQPESDPDFDEDFEGLFSFAPPGRVDRV